MIIKSCYFLFVLVNALITRSLANFSAPAVIGGLAGGIYSNGFIKVDDKDLKNKHFKQCYHGSLVKAKKKILSRRKKHSILSAKFMLRAFVTTLYDPTCNGLLSLSETSAAR